MPDSGFGQAAGGGPCIHIFLSLYKVQASIYLLDFQKMDGNPFDFMALCARVITELKALSQVSLASLFARLAFYVLVLLLLLLFSLTKFTDELKNCQLIKT